MLFSRRPILARHGVALSLSRELHIYDNTWN